MQIVRSDHRCVFDRKIRWGLLRFIAAFERGIASGALSDNPANFAQIKNHDGRVRYFEQVERRE